MTKKYKCRVEYLESTGTQYINTGYKLNSNSVLEISACSTDATQSNNTLLGVGTSAGSADRVQVHFGSAAGTLSIRLDGTLSSNQSVGTNKFISKIDISNKKAYFNNIEIVSNYTGSIDTTDNVALFNRMISGNVIESEYAAKAKVYYLRISENNALVRDMIPVLDNSGRPAMYDQVSGQLFYNQGTGEFTYGRQIIPVEYLESTGTQYIDTGVKGKNNLQYKTKINYTNLSTSASNGIGGEYLGNASAYIGMVRANGHFTYLFNNTAVETTKTFYANTDYVIDSTMNNGSQIVKVNNETISTGTLSGTFTSTRNIFLYAVCSTNDAADVYGSLKMYYCKIYDNDVLVRDFIPCIDENLTPFMFDKVQNTVYLNAGTGQFKVGPNVEKSWSGKKLRKKLALALANLKKKRKYYCEVEYLEGTGTQYIDTGLDYFADFEVGIKLRNNVSNKALGNGIFYCMQRYNATQSYWSFTTNNSSYVSSVLITEYHVLKWKDDTIYADGTQITTKQKSSNSGNNMSLFGAGGQTFPNIIYFCKLWNPSDGTLVRDFIPVLDWNMVPCMYDKVTETLFYNQGTGDFTAGREIHYVEYLESTGTQYIDTGIKFDGANTKIELKTYENSLTRRHSICGDDGNFFYYFRGTGNWAVGYNGTAANIDSYMSVGDNVFVMDKNNVYVNGVLAQTYTASSSVSSYNALLFNRKTSLVDNGVVTMYYCKIWNNNVLVRDYIPAIDSNGTAFMFDRVSHTCFLNQGTGAFKYPAREVEYLTSNGNQYIDTGINPTDEYGYRIKNTYTAGQGEQCAIGCMDSNNRFVGVYTGGPANAISGAWGSFVGFLPNYPWTTGTILDVEVNYKNSRKMIVNGTELKDISDIHVSGTVSNTLYLFARHYGSTITKMKGNVYGVEITNSQNVVANFIPAFKDGQVGMYDKVSGVLKTNIGTGSFSVGRILEPEYE